MSSAVPDVEQIEARERDLLERLPLEAEHVPDAETQAYDARLEAVFTTAEGLVVVGGLAVNSGTPLELKTCQRWIVDNGSAGGRRRGRFHVSEATHENLAELGGVYLFAVLEGEEILAARMVPPEELGEVVCWTGSGDRYATRKAGVPWPRVVPKREVEG